MAVMGDVVDARKAAAVVSDVTTTEDAACAITCCIVATATSPSRGTTLCHTRHSTKVSSAPRPRGGGREEVVSSWQALQEFRVIIGTYSLIHGTGSRNPRGAL